MTAIKQALPPLQPRRCGMPETALHAARRLWGG